MSELEITIGKFDKALEEQVQATHVCQAMLLAGKLQDVDLSSLFRAGIKLITHVGLVGTDATEEIKLLAQQNKIAACALLDLLCANPNTPPEIKLEAQQAKIAACALYDLLCPPEI